MTIRISTVLHSAFWLVVSIWAVAQTARAAEFDQSRMVVHEDRGWDIIVSPYVWGASLNGNGALAGLTTDVDVPFSETLKHLDFALMGNIEVTNGQWGAYIDAQHVRTSQEEDVFHHQLDLKIIQTNIAGGVFYRVYNQELGGTTVFGRPRVFAVEPTVGVRWTRLVWRARIPACATSGRRCGRSVVRPASP